MSSHGVADTVPPIDTFIIIISWTSLEILVFTKVAAGKFSS